MTHIAPDGTEYRVADAHAHVYKGKIAAKASDAIGAFYVTGMYEPEPTADNLVEKGCAFGVDRYVVFGAATAAKQVEGINQFIAAEVARFPQHFVGLGTAHPDLPSFEPLLEQLHDLGLQGIKLHPDMQDFNLDDARMMLLYHELARRGMIVCFHVGDERYDRSAPERLLRVLDEVPDLRVHAAHFGCCRIWRRRPVAIEAAVRAGANIVFDTSSMLGWATPSEARELVDILGVERVMWGTDYPMWGHDDEFGRLLALGLTPQQNQAVLYDNFARFYLGEGI